MNEETEIVIEKMPMGAFLKKVSRPFLDIVVVMSITGLAIALLINLPAINPATASALNVIVASVIGLGILVATVKAMIKKKPQE